MKPAHQLLTEIREKCKDHNGRPISWDAIAAKVGVTRKTLQSWLNPQTVIHDDNYAALIAAHHDLIKGQTGPSVNPVDRMRAEMKGWIDGMSDRGAKRLYPTLLRAFKEDAVLRDPKMAIRLLREAGHLPQAEAPTAEEADRIADELLYGHEAGAEAPRKATGDDGSARRKAGGQ